MSTANNQGVSASIVVGTTVTLIVENNGRRDDLTIINGSSVAVLVGFVADELHMSIPAGGEFISDTYTGRIYGTVDSGTATVTTIEVIR
jgi:hypothetical protein